MSEVLEVIIAVVGLLGTIMGILGVSAYISERQKHKASKKNAQEDRIEADLREYEQQRKEEAFRNIVRGEIEPLRQEIEVIKENTKNSLESDVLSLRCQMKIIRDRCMAQGYADIGDKATMIELEEKYKSLGGNNFKEYVAQWMKDVADLPLKPKTTKKTSKKQILVENKK